MNLRGIFNRRKRVPFIPQMEAAECGAASLAMILAYYEHHLPLVEAREACGVSRDGANALAILRAARCLAMDAEAVKVEMPNLGDLPLPAILHWDFSHFLVLERLQGPHQAILVDPALGRRVVDLEEVHRRFTGVALVFAPDDGFTPRPRTRPSLRRYRDLLQAALPNLAQLLGASFMLQGLGLVFPISTQLLLDRVIVPRQEAWLWGLAIGLGAATVGKILLGLVRSWVIQGLQISLDQNLLGHFIEHLLHLPLGFFLQRSPGDLAQRVQSNTFIRNLFTSRSVSSLLDVFLLVGYSALMVAYSPFLGGVILLFGALRVGLLLLFKERNQRIMAGELAAAGREGGALLEALSAFETVKASGAEERMVQRWSDRMVERMNASLERRALNITSAQGMVLLQGLAIASVFGLGGREVLAERMSLGVFAAFLTLQVLFLGPLESLLEAVGQLQFLDNHLGRLDDVLETAPEPSGAADPGRLQGGIQLEGVAYAYNPGAPLVIQGITLAIRPGEKIALVGPTGAGKSTLARLLLGMHLPSQGQIRFDGNDLGDLNLHRLRNQMGVVLQETFLFDDSIRANLSLNDPELSLDRLKWAAEQACILETIEAMPKGFDSRVGENGRMLSGGQRQRLSLARALAHNPAVLVLDEATSSVDLATEARIHANLAGLGCTRILIAHRLATVKDADRIFVVQEGRIVQEGNFERLSTQTGLFRELVSAIERSDG